MVYKQLSLTERHYIELQYKLGASMNKISKELNRSQSTISREISRNTGKRGYRHKQANELALSRHKEKDKAYKLTPEQVQGSNKTKKRCLPSSKTQRQRGQTFKRI